MTNVSKQGLSILLFAVISVLSMSCSRGVSNTKKMYGMWEADWKRSKISMPIPADVHISIQLTKKGTIAIWPFDIQGRYTLVDANTLIATIDHEPDYAREIQDTTPHMVGRTKHSGKPAKLDLYIVGDELRWRIYRAQPGLNEVVFRKIDQ